MVFKMWLITHLLAYHFNCMGTFDSKTADDVINYGESFIGVRYEWGGNNPEQGFDCSGLWNEVFKAYGLLPYNIRMSSGQMYLYFLPKSVSSGIKRGTILFFGKDKDNISHVAMALNDWQMLEAGGEGRESTTDGMVRKRPIANRKDLVAAINLF